MRLRIARSASEMDGLRPAWDFLYAESADATLFQSFAWNRLAAAQFAGRESPFVVLAECDSGIALIPAAMTSSGLSLLGEELFDYRDVFWAGDDRALRAGWTRLAELQLPLSVTAVRECPTRNAWVPFEPLPFVNAPQVLCGEPAAEAFASAHSRLGRTLRLLAKRGAELRQYSGAASDFLRRLYREKGGAVPEQRRQSLSRLHPA